MFNKKLLFLLLSILIGVCIQLNSQTINNLAKSKPVYVSSIYSGQYPAVNANDGNIETGWGSAIYDKTPYIFMDLKSKYIITKISINFLSGFQPALFKIGGSLDASSWILSTSLKGVVSYQIDISQYNLEFQYIGLMAESLSGPVLGVMEFEVYGFEKTTPTPTITPVITTTPISTTEGYYKDVFMDGGYTLFANTNLYAADYAKLSYEYVATADTTTQNNVMVKNANDANGVLLYPDGEPRFKALYTNGTPRSYLRGATDHGNSLGAEGREIIRTFFKNGGSYTGSCAGAFITCKYTADNSSTNPAYYQIWPGRMNETNLFEPTGHFIENNSPLLNYYDFGGDLYVAKIVHWGGGYADESFNFPIGTIVLARYDYAAGELHKKPSTWAFKPNAESGRIVVIGSHPEDETSGEGLQLMAAILRYAIDGLGTISAKASLSDSIARVMNKATEDKDPLFTKIGDKQYHHFKVEVPANKSLTVTLNGKAGIQLNLYLKKNSFAFNSNADYKEISLNTDKSLTTTITSGIWYIGVECATTIDTKKVNWGYEYSGKLEVLNGVPYTITAKIGS